MAAWMFGMRRHGGPADRNATAAVEAAQLGFATRSFPAGPSGGDPQGAQQISEVPSDLLAINKRVCHRSMEAAGIATGCARPPI